MPRTFTDADLAHAGRVVHTAGLGAVGGIREAPAGRIVQMEMLAELAGEGAPFAAVRELSKKNEWGYSDGQLRRVYRLAEKLAYRRLRVKAKNAFQAGVLRVEGIFRRAVEMGDLASQLRAQQELNKLHGLYPAGKSTLEVKHSGSVEHQLKVTAQQVFAEISEYEQEFRLAAKAERIERQIQVVTGAEMEEAGAKVTHKERNEVSMANVPYNGDEPHTDEPRLEDVDDGDN